MAAPSPLKMVREFFDHPDRPFKLGDMKTEWSPMSAKDKQDIISGLTDGTLTYKDKQDIISGLTDGTLTY